MEDNERWIPVPGFEGFYEVSDHGRLRSLRCGMGVRTRPRIVQGDVGENRYLRWRLFTPSIGRVGTRFLAHRLVLSAFGGACPDGMECAHKDGDRMNNRLSNLEWVSHAENIQHRDLHGTTAWGERGGNHKLTEQEVHTIRARYARGADSHKSIAADYGVCQATISHILSGRNWRRLEKAA